MGLIQDIAGPLAEGFSRLGLASQIGVTFASFLFVVVSLNVLQQVLFKNPNEPPVVFHWFPFVGSTITYGMDPPRFFKENRAKVGDLDSLSLIRPSSCTPSNRLAHSTVWRLLHLYPAGKENDRVRGNPGQ